MTDALASFLQTRLGEDEQVAVAVLGVNVMAGVKRGKSAPRWVPSPEGDAGIWDTGGALRVKYLWTRERDHIIRHDPARVLAEVSAKRRIVEIHEVIGGFTNEGSTGLGLGCGECGYSAEYSNRGGWCETLRLLALPYAGHDDYREEWRP